MDIEILAIEPEKIDFSPSTVVDEIRQNLFVILTTPIGSVPMDRDFGIDMGFVDNPVVRAMMKARISILEAIQDYEPRVEVKSIDFVNDTATDGKLIAKVKVRIYDEYIT